MEYDAPSEVMQVAEESRHDAWSAGSSYERYMGRWSRQIASRFVDWLDEPAGRDWLDVGCGTGSLTNTILAQCSPRSVLGVDPSEGFVEHARNATPDPRARYEVGTASELPCPDGPFDVVASALAYNFFPDRPAALAEMLRAARHGGTVAFYVWDYPGDGMGFLHAFWKTAAALDPGAEHLAETRRFPFCTPETLLEEARAAGMIEPRVEAIEVRSRFEDFEDFWRPFTLGAGPAPGYVASLEATHRDALREALHSELGDRIEFPARAWGVRGRSR